MPEARDVPPDDVLHVSGTRQTGKSTLLRRWASPGRSVLLRMDVESIRAAGIAGALEAVRSAGLHPEIVLVDDVHLLPDWRDQIDPLNGVRAILAGQHTPPEGAARVELRPLSFRRFLEARCPAVLRGLPEPICAGRLLGSAADLRDHLWAVHRTGRELGQTWERHLGNFARRGGYPGVVYGGPAWADYLLAQVVDRALGIDAPARAPVEQPALLRRIFCEVARRTGSEISQGELARDLGAAQPVVGRYLDHLEGVGLVREFRRYPVTPSARVPSKATLTDPGVREAVLRVQADAYDAPLAETLVQTALRDRDVEVRFWRDYEKPSDRRSPVQTVSFVLERAGGEALPVQVSAGPEVAFADERALRSFLARFEAPHGILVTRDTFRVSPDDPVLRVPLRELLVALA